MGLEVACPVYINDGEADVGDIVRVKVEQAGDDDLVGGIVGTVAKSRFKAPEKPAVPAPSKPAEQHASRRLLNVLPVRH